MTPGCKLKSATIDSLITTSALAKTEAIAVKDLEKEYTYAELLSFSKAVTRALKNNGVDKGDTICLMCERGFQGLAAAIGILASGAIYVPISIEYPQLRKEFIINDSNAKIIITDNKKNIPNTEQHLIFEIRELAHQASICGTETNHHPISICHTPEDAAYILYTSGSTGRPKGVVVSHQAQINTFNWMIQAFSLKKGECIPQKTPWSFTDSLWEMFLPLIYGGVVGFVSEMQIRHPVELYARLNHLHAVITQFVPPAMSVFLDDIEQQLSAPEFKNLRWVLNGGEELPRTIVERWFNIFPNVGYANSYGMTESAIYATCYFMEKPPVWGMRRIPVGKPISNAEVCILSDTGSLLTEDSIGEICVGGKSLMSEYWNQPELTEKAFAIHPENGNRLYKTGDYGAYRTDGQIAYLGRKDDQVKILGMRVELKEIQRVILDHPAVKQAYLITRGESETKTLIAFYTTGSHQVDESALTAYLRTILPPYMVPSFCINVDEMPLTEHNKTDLKKLTQISLEHNKANPGSYTFRGEIEEELSTVWRENLGHRNYGPDDPFFHVGGNSLMLIRVYGQLPQRYRNMLTIPDLLTYPTIRSLARHLLSKEKNRGKNSFTKRQNRFGRLASRRAKRT